MEKNIATIYKITNKINGKVYIGYDSSYPKRIKQHYNASKRNVEGPLYEDIRKYGWNNFTKEAIYHSWNKEYCLNNMENHFIVEYDSVICGYNRTLGGDGTLNSPRPKSEEWRKKHSIRMKTNNPRKGYSFSENEKLEHSLKMKEYYVNNSDKILYGEKNGMFGKKHTEEWKKQHSLKMKMNTNSVKSMQEKRPCKHCGKITTLGNLSRWHNENCSKLIKVE
jgi:group I intron endonuclease